jgi:hypothetical protein
VRVVKKSPKRKNNTFWKKHKYWLLILFVVLVVAYILIYIDFKGDGFFEAGMDLEKKDWLAFLGAYLTFAGTIGVSFVASLQTRYFAEIEKEKSGELRKKELQPIFSIVIEGIDKHIEGATEVYKCNNVSPQHKNITISVENVGNYPILNVTIFDNYMFQLLKPNDKKQFQIAYSDSPDVLRWKNHVIEILESEYERTDEGIPKWFNITYDDIDGNVMFQTFELKTFDKDRYYSLGGIHEM